MNRTCILIHWKAEKEYEVFSSLKVFTDEYPTFNVNSITHQISRNKKPYDDAVVRIERVSYNLPA